MPPIALVAADERTACSYHALRDLPPIESISLYANATLHSVMLSVEPTLGAGDGTVDPSCAVSERAVTLFSTRRQIDALELPSGAPLALPASGGLVIRAHFLNPDDFAAETLVYVDLQPASGPTPMTSGLVSATRMDFSVPPGISTQETRCRLSPGVTIAGLYPDARKLTYEIDVGDESGPLVSTYDWEHPDHVSFEPPRSPAGDLVAHCRRVNGTTVTGTGGPTLTEERCGVSALVVPAAGVASCLIP